MRKSFIISGVFTLIVLALFLTGAVNFDNGASAALARGNRYYEAGELQKALESYAAGLENAPQDPVLNYNSAQALYSMKEYGQALGYYEKGALKKADRYLNMGNSCLRLADTAGDENQKQQLYQQALQIYHEGILEFPQEVSLKYNYEYVKEKLQQQQQDNQQNQENNGNRQNNEEQNNDQGQNNNEGQQGENQDENKDQSQDGNEENQEQNGDENSGQEDSEDQQEQQQESQSGEDGEDKDGGSEGSSEENQQSLSEIEQALRALEQQEEDSLKNNQTIRGSGKEDKYDW